MASTGEEHRQHHRAGSVGGPHGRLAEQAVDQVDDFVDGSRSTPPLAPPVVDPSRTVTFERSGTAAANSGDTLLLQAEAAGLTPEYGCRMGICFSCTQVKTSGCTRNVLTGELNNDPDVEVQLCISAPVGDVALDI